jgi:leucyl aminopeptidase (aminopeptidase T)
VAEEEKGGDRELTIADDLNAAAQAALGCLGVGPSDDVLVLWNVGERSVAEALAAAAEGRASSVRLVEYPTLSRDGEEPPPAVARAMLQASAVFAVTRYSLSHTQARLAATARGVRVAGMGGLTEETFARTVPIDYALLRGASARLAARLTAADSCRISSPAGTDVTLSIRDRQATSDDGHLQAPGAFGNLPAGEAYIAPLETIGDGTIVFDGALAGHGLLEAPLRLQLEAGRAVAAEGEAADWLLSTLDAGGEHGRSIAEIGIGTNPGARLCGQIAVDEKARGTAHLAFGTSVSFGGVNQAAVHIDGILREPTIELDGRPLHLNNFVSSRSSSSGATAPTRAGSKEWSTP